MPFNSETASAAGKKSKRGVSQRAKILDDLFDKEKATKVFLELEKQATAGDLEAIKVYLAYCFGKPEAKVDVTTDGESLNYDLAKLSTGQLKNLYEIKSSIDN